MTKGRRQKQTGIKSIGHTDRLSIYILFIIIVTILMGFYLAVESIKYNYTGALICFTAAIAPLDAALSFVLGKVVDKNKAENTGGNGDGIKFAIAQASGFSQNDHSPTATKTFDDINSPAI